MDEFGLSECLFQLRVTFVLRRGELKLPHDTLCHHQERLLLDNFLKVRLEIEIAISDSVVEELPINHYPVRRLKFVYNFEVLYILLILFSSFNSHFNLSLIKIIKGGKFC